MTTDLTVKNGKLFELELTDPQSYLQKSIQHQVQDRTNSSLLVPPANKKQTSTIVSNPTKNISDQYDNFNSRFKVSNENNKNPNTKYCLRHRPDSMCRRTADELTMEMLQKVSYNPFWPIPGLTAPKNLEILSRDDQESISHVWSLFSTAPAKHRNLMLQGILAQCCFPQLSYLSSSVRDLIRIDFIVALPCEISLRILSFLDTTSLCKAAQVSREWRRLADDDAVWHRMCEQHIDRKCNKCGWGLPLLERKQLRDSKNQLQLRATGFELSQRMLSSSLTYHEEDEVENVRQFSSNLKKRKADELVCDEISIDCKTIKQQQNITLIQKFRPWKEVYKDRFQIGSNWKYGRCSTKILRGHSNGVMCLQIEDNMLATGSYDQKIKIWNLDSGECIRTLRGHTSGIRALQFDNQKLISGSLDKTIRIWNWRTGECVNAYPAHSSGVIALNFVNNILASGSMDMTVKVWNFEDKSVFVLQGHTDWVNAVRVDASSRTLFSASDDRTVRLWDLDTRQTIQIFEGHVGQVTQIVLFTADLDLEEDDTDKNDGSSICSTPDAKSRTSTPLTTWHESWPSKRPNPPRYMLTGALDSTVRLWDVSTGRCLRTLFGHVEGIWALAGDTLRIVTGAEDKMVKVWDVRSGRCENTFTGHSGPVTCIGLSDSRMCTGSEDGTIRMYCFNQENLITRNEMTN